MKKIYETPTMEILQFAMEEDLAKGGDITPSDVIVPDSVMDEEGWLNIWV